MPKPDYPLFLVFLLSFSFLGCLGLYVCALSFPSPRNSISHAGSFSFSLRLCLMGVEDMVDVSPLAHMCLPFLM